MSYEHWPYLSVFAVLIAAGLGLPLPEDIPLLTGGYLCHLGLARLPIMIAICMLGVLAGDFILFGVGRRFGHHVVEHRFVRRIVHPSRLLLAEQLFERHGIKIIFFGRFLPVLRPMIFMACGVLRVRLVVFAAVDGFAACISVPVLILLGKFFGQNIDQLKRDVRIAMHTLSLFGILAILVGLGVYLYRRQQLIMKQEVPSPDCAEQILHAEARQEEQQATQETPQYRPQDDGREPSSGQIESDPRKP